MTTDIVVTSERIGRTHNPPELRPGLVAGSRDGGSPLLTLSGVSL